MVRNRCEYIAPQTDLKGKKVLPLFDEKGNLIFTYAKRLVKFLLALHDVDMSGVIFYDSDFKKMDPSACAIYGLTKIGYNSHIEW